MKFHIFLSLLLVFSLNLSAVYYEVYAQNAEEKPAVALLRHRQSSAAIEIIVDAELVKDSPVSVSVYKKEGLVSKKIAGNPNVKICDEPFVPGVICKDESFPHPGKVIFVYPFTHAPEAAEKYLAAFSINDAKRGLLEQIVGVSLDIERIKPTVELFDKGQQFHTNERYGKVNFKPNGVIKLEIEFPDENDPANKEFDEYVDERIEEIYGWLELKTVTPTEIAAIRVEPQTKDELPQNYKVIGLEIQPSGRNRARQRRKISILLITDRKFPAEKFALEVVFKDDPPPELMGRLLNTIDGIANLKPLEASEVGDDTTLGLRTIKTNLDLGLAFTSSVESRKENGVSTRRRENDGVIDLMFAPIHNLPLDRSEQHFFTPFFVDAKVSSGNVTENSLALNRILLGTEYSIRWRPNDGRFNKYIFSFRGLNASDRDFKRAEAKFNFEFRPLFDKLNNPLTVQYKNPLPDSVLIPENGKKYIRTGWFGYQIQPFVGFEVGRVYRARRDAFDNEENSRNIRRLFFGTDMVFNLTRFANIQVSDTLYLRGELDSARYRNYFISTLEAPIITSGNTAQSIFFSFERGDQPPFATPSVNSLKIGYRITSNFSDRTP